MNQLHAHPPSGSAMQRVNRFAWLLDNSIRIPGTRYRIGLDPLIGLVPGIGDSVGALLSMVILWEAYRARLPAAILARMGLNVALEVVIGVIPLIGDLFDMAFKANARNARLMERYQAESRKTVASSTLLMIAVAVLLTLIVAVSIYVGFVILRRLWSVAVA